MADLCGIPASNAGERAAYYEQRMRSNGLGNADRNQSVRDNGALRQRDGNGRLVNGQEARGGFAYLGGDTLDRSGMDADLQAHLKACDLMKQASRR